jgi:hypothetical protein
MKQGGETKKSGKTRKIRKRKKRKKTDPFPKKYPRWYQTTS